MTKLKTLKEIEKIFIPLTKAVAEDAPLNIAKPVEYVKIEDLRAEAIKWIKELRADMKETDKKLRKLTGCPEGPEYSVGGGLGVGQALMDEKTIAQIGWIKHFFNITEEELK